MAQQGWHTVSEASRTSFWPTKFCELCAMMMPPSVSMNCFSFASAAPKCLFEICNDATFYCHASYMRELRRTFVIVSIIRARGPATACI